MRLLYLAVAALAAVFASSDAVPTAVESGVSFVDRVTHDRVNEADAKRFLRAADASNVLPSMPANTEEERAGIALPEWAGQFATKMKAFLNFDEVSMKVKKGSKDAWGRTGEWREKFSKEVETRGASLRQKMGGQEKVKAVKDWFTRVFKSNKNAAANDVEAAPAAT